MTEIILRSPVRSVGRFRCVSKAFCSLLTDPRFAKNHLGLNLRTLNRKVILSLNNLFAVDIDSIGDGSEGNRKFPAVELDYPLKQERDLLPVMKTRTARYTIWSDAEMAYSDYDQSRVVVVGSSNGLLCVSSDDDIVFLYNPTTGESKRIPDLPESMRPKLVNKDMVAYDIHGFGFDALKDDYKVVKFVVSGSIGNVRNNELEASVYSLRADSWRRICNLRYKHVHPTSGVHLNGAIHWIVKLKEDPNKRVVAAFDLETEEFREIPLPDEAGECNHPFMKLDVGSLKGSLCVSYSCHVVHDDIWVMNEYGLQSSWCKIRISILYTSMKPICSTKNDKEVVLMIDRSLVLYNFECDTWRALRIRKVKLGDGFEGNTYVESLISPNSYGVES
ncbi:unnamed protein product [Arabis nemorensis]|uniref:F-box associated beta-propeller type 1 domain-containing protein n=1 Tax=Arabis nemorensis TaxID=586526 RepID=A0A565B4R5_9BRAS|nr:unnamed protein product [Arabis nemorensis]